MSITVSVTGNTPEELKAHVAWLADKLGATTMMSDIIKTHINEKHDQHNAAAEEAVGKIETVIEAAVSAEKTTKKANAKAETTVEPSDVADLLQPTEQHSITADQLQELAGNKKLIVGAPRVKEVIASFGATNIRLVPVEMYADLYAAIEALK